MKNAVATLYSTVVRARVGVAGAYLKLQARDPCLLIREDSRGIPASSYTSAKQRMSSCDIC